MRALVLALWLSVPICLAQSAQAEGLVQLTLRGEVEVPGGAPIELELGIWDGEEVREVALNIHLGHQTRAGDLALLLATRLRRVGAKVDFPAESHPGEAANLFIEAVTHVNMRLGHGLSGAITLCDSAPNSIRVQQPEITFGPTFIEVSASTFHPHDRRIGRADLRLEIDELATAPQISEELASASIEGGWMADRPSADRWAASRTRLGAQITGCSVSLGKTHADWRLEVELALPRSDGSTPR